MPRDGRKRAARFNPRSVTEPDKDLGTRIRISRIDKGISQVDLGKAIRVSFQQIQKYERGYNRLSATKLRLIAEALDTTPNDLLGWDGKGNVSGPFDQGAYALAKEFGPLPEQLRIPYRHAIAATMEYINQKKK
jgi:transcriptional regulator with XRE-family HTH domain